MSAERIELEQELEQSLADQCAIRGTMISNAIIHLYSTGNFRTADRQELEALYFWIGAELQDRTPPAAPYSQEPF